MSLHNAKSLISTTVYDTRILPNMPPSSASFDPKICVSRAARGKVAPFLLRIASYESLFSCFARNVYPKIVNNRDKSVRLTAADRSPVQVALKQGWPVSLRVTFIVSLYKTNRGFHTWKNTRGCVSNRLGEKDIDITGAEEREIAGVQQRTA